MEALDEWITQLLQNVQPDFELVSYSLALLSD